MHVFALWDIAPERWPTGALGMNYKIDGLCVLEWIDITVAVQISRGNVGRHAA